MKVGDLVRVVNGGPTLSLWLGEVGVIVKVKSLRPYFHDVLIGNKIKRLNMRYLEVV
jgi:hypothetical protein